jgi:hypothetical protein
VSIGVTTAYGTPIAMIALTQPGTATPKNPNAWRPNLAFAPLSDRAKFAANLYGDRDVTLGVMSEIGARGGCWWDLEGSRHHGPPYSLGFYGSVQLLSAGWSPEIHAAADGYFKPFTDAGFTIGYTIRATVIQETKSGWKYHDEPWAVVPKIVGDIRYGHNRWGSTGPYYLDSPCDWLSTYTYDWRILKAVCDECPEATIISEHYIPGSENLPNVLTYRRVMHSERRAPIGREVLDLQHDDPATVLPDVSADIAAGSIKMVRGWWPDAPELKLVR